LAAKDLYSYLPQLDSTQLLIPLERCREKLASNPAIVDDQNIPVTISIGTTCFRTDVDNAIEMLEKADTALYHSKNTGRNRCTLSCDTQLKDRA
jgi:diguanylate cyclase (GGDEF)-like protein